MRQLVQAGGADEATDARDPIVVRRDLAARGGVRRLAPHRAKLPHHDFFLVEAVAALAKEDGAGAVQSDGERDQRHDRRHKQQSKRAQGQVQHPLGEGAAGVAAGLGQRRQRRTGQTVQRCVAAAVVHQHGDRIGQGLQLARQLPRARAGLRVDGQDDVIHVGRDPVCDQGLGVAQHRHADQAVRRPRQPVVEHAQHIDVAPFHGAADQGLSVAGRPDHDHIRPQHAPAAPAQNHAGPQRMKEQQHARPG